MDFAHRTLLLVKGVLVINLPKSKRGMQERAVIDDASVARVLAELHVARGARRLATDLKYHQFAAALRRLCRLGTRAAVHLSLASPRWRQQSCGQWPQD